MPREASESSGWQRGRAEEAELRGASSRADVVCSRQPLRLWPLAVVVSVDKMVEGGRRAAQS